MEQSLPQRGPQVLACYKYVFLDYDAHSTKTRVLCQYEDAAICLQSSRSSLMASTIGPSGNHSIPLGLSTVPMAFTLIAKCHEPREQSGGHCVKGHTRKAEGKKGR